MDAASSSKKTTKQLARELGLLKKRKMTTKSPMGKKKSKIDQIFSYLVVLDFESTCWENDKTIPQEIIEFPVVLLNCRTGLIEDTFHHYIQPSEQPILNQFCTTLTGITQDKVDSGIPLAVCLRKFYYWLKRLEVSKGIICVTDKHLSPSPTDEKKGNETLAAFVTWSDWDLGVCLLNETRRKQVMKPSPLNRWIDLRATYRKFYGRRPDGLNGAMKDLGLQFDGREHSGIDDAKNTARLAYKMICDGCLFNITKALKTKGRDGVEVTCNPTPLATSRPISAVSTSSSTKRLFFNILEDNPTTTTTTTTTMTSHRTPSGDCNTSVGMSKLREQEMNKLNTQQQSLGQGKKFSDSKITINQKGLSVRNINSLTNLNVVVSKSDDPVINETSAHQPYSRSNNKSYDINSKVSKHQTMSTTPNKNNVVVKPLSRFSHCNRGSKLSSTSTRSTDVSSVLPAIPKKDAFFIKSPSESYSSDSLLSSSTLSCDQNERSLSPSSSSSSVNSSSISYTLPNNNNKAQPKLFTKSTLSAPFKPPLPVASTSTNRPLSSSKSHLRATNRQRLPSNVPGAIDLNKKRPLSAHDLTSSSHNNSDIVSSAYQTQSSINTFQNDSAFHPQGDTTSALSNVPSENVSIVSARPRSYKPSIYSFSNRNTLSNTGEQQTTFPAGSNSNNSKHHSPPSTVSNNSNNSIATFKTPTTSKTFKPQNERKANQTNIFSDSHSKTTKQTHVVNTKTSTSTSTPPKSKQVYETRSSPSNKLVPSKIHSINTSSLVSSNSKPRTPTNAITPTSYKLCSLTQSGLEEFRFPSNTNTNTKTLSSQFKALINAANSSSTKSKQSLETKTKTPSNNSTSTSKTTKPVFKTPVSSLCKSPTTKQHRSPVTTKRIITPPQSVYPSHNPPPRKHSNSYSNNSTNNNSFRTPTMNPGFKPTTMKATPPLCSCGRRSRRRLVQNPGPNEGRWFFSCSAGTRTSSNGNSGCGFFKWE